MCDDYPDVWDPKVRKARKSHVCDECRESIQPGDSYLSIGCVYDGSGSTIKLCLRCDKVINKLPSPHEDSCSPVGSFYEYRVLDDYRGAWDQIPEDLREIMPQWVKDRAGRARDDRATI